MKPYESLCIEILRFDAQDIVTASYAATTDCICTAGCFEEYIAADGLPAYITRPHPTNSCNCPAEDGAHFDTGA